MADQENQPAPDVNATPLPGVGAAVAAPVPMDTSQSGKTSTYSATQDKPTPEAIAALGELSGAVEGTAKAQEGVGEAKATQQTAIADQQGTEAERLEAAAANAAAERQDYIDRVHAAQQLQQEDAQTLKDYKFHDFFHDADGKREVGRSLLTGIGGLFASAGGTEAAKAVAEQQDKMIGRDFDRQRQDYSKLMDQRKMAGEDVSGLYTEWERANAASLYKEGLAREAAAARAVEIATRSGIPVSQAENNVFVQQQRAKGAQLKLESLSHYDKHVTSGSTTEARKTETTGKPGAGPQITDKERAADAAVEKLTNDTNKMTAQPYTADEADVIRRTLSSDPSLRDKISGFFSGDAPDYFRRLTPEQQDHVGAALRALPIYAAQQFGPKGASNPAALNAMALSLLPRDTDDESAKKRRQNVFYNSIKSQAETTPRPAYWRGKIDALMAPAAAPGTAPAIVAPTAAQGQLLGAGFKPIP